MKKQTRSKISLLLALLMLLASVTLTSCNDPASTEQPASTSTDQSGGPTPTEDPLWKNAIHTEDKELGEGEKTFTLKVTAGEKSITLTVHTNEKTLADALLALELVEGEDGAYGLYIKKVNGILADYDVDNHYWSLLVGGETSFVGASGVDVTDGASFELCRVK